MLPRAAVGGGAAGPFGCRPAVAPERRGSDHVAAFIAWPREQAARRG
ncbi:hypothetical protein GIY62_26905 [Burkholderia plantarii]|nr:hypothetical protein GIY62_26905 [Burkholderia plantarii]